MASLQQIISWFKTGLYPNEDQFRQTWLSYWHKSEKIPQSQIFGLQETIESATQGLIYRPPVATSADLYTTYPDAKTGWAAIVEATGTIWQCEVQSDGTKVWTDTGLREFPANVATQEDLETLVKKADVANESGTATDKPISQDFYTKEITQIAREMDNAFKENSDIGDIAHVFSLLSGEMTGYVNTKGEWNIPYLLSWIFSSKKIVIENLAEINSAGISDIELKKDSAGNVLYWIDSIGRMHIPHTIVNSMILQGGYSTEVVYGKDIQVFKDSKNNVFAWIDSEGRVHIPHLVANSEENETDDIITTPLENLKIIQTSISKDFFIKDLAKGVFSKKGDKKMPFVVTFTDDDGIDYYKSPGTTVEPYKGGYYSRLHPVFASKGVPFTEFHIGNRESLYNESLVLQDLYRDEIGCHSLSHENGWYDSSISGEHVLTTQSGWSDEWNESLQKWVIRDPIVIETYFRREWSYGKKKMEKAGFTIKNGAVFNGGRTSHRLRRIQRDMGYGCIMSNDGYSKDKLFYNTPPIATFGVYRDNTIGGNSTATVTEYLKAGTDDINARFNLIKQKIDVVAANGGWLDLYTHAYYRCFMNFNPDFVDPTYPEEWIVPVSDPGSQDEGYSFGHKIPKGWYPYPNTMLDLISKLIDYIQSKGGIIATVEQARQIFANQIEIGDLTYNKRKAPYDDLTYDHYVKGIDGSEEFLKLK